MLSPTAPLDLTFRTVKGPTEGHSYFEDLYLAKEPCQAICYY